MHLSRFPQLKDACVIEDDKNTSCVPTEDPRNSNKSKREKDFMPSFNLLDEDELEEVGPSIETEDSECRIITARTVFDHIREKAKSFPSLVTSSNACSPSTEALQVIRKRTRQKQLEHNYAIEGMEEAERNEVPRSSGQREEHSHVIGNASLPHPALCFDTIYAVDDIGELPSESVESTSKFLTGETIFEHIRKKAKNFPIVNKLKSLDSESFATTNEHLTKNQLESKSGAFDVMEPKFSNPMVTNEFSSIGGSGKKLYSPSVSRGQCCSVATVKETREVDSILGFKSVFSFL